MNKHYDNNYDKRLSIISLSSIDMCIHLMWYHKDVNKSDINEAVKMIELRVRSDEAVVEDEKLDKGGFDRHR